MPFRASLSKTLGNAVNQVFHMHLQRNVINIIINIDYVFETYVGATFVIM